MADAEKAAVSPLATRRRAPLHAVELIFYPSALVIAVLAFWYF